MEQFAYSLSPKIEIVDVTNQAGSVVGSRMKQILGLRKLYRQQKPDVVVSFITRTNICAILAGIGVDVPVIVSERNNPMVDPASRSTRKLRNLVYPLADGFVFQTKFAKECFPASIQNRSAVIFNPVSNSVMDTSAVVKRKRIIAVGRLEPQKNYSMMLRALARILPKYPKYCVDIFGLGGLFQKIQSEIDEMGMSGRVVLRGFSSRTIAEMAESEIYLMTSDFEGMPNALMEAMCVGCACISTDAPAYGARELIRDGDNGFLIPVNDEQALCRKLESLLSNPLKIKEFGEKAREVYSCFNVEAVVDQWLAYVESVRER